MSEIELVIPSAIPEALPEEDDSPTLADMQRAIAGWQHHLDRILADEDRAGEVVDLIERFEERWERYDALVPELRAWGQSPIYAMVWRDLHAALIQQLCDHEPIADRIDRERHARIVEDGIRFQD